MNLISTREQDTTSCVIQLHDKSLLSDEKGATMMEFMMIGLMVIALVGMAFDVGYGLHRYSILTNACTTASRKVASSLTISNAAPSCASINSSARTSAGDFIENTLSMTPAEVAAGITFNSNIVSDTVSGSADQALIRVSGTWKYNCTLCLMIGKQIELKTTSEAFIERFDFQCT